MTQVAAIRPLVSAYLLSLMRHSRLMAGDNEIDTLTRADTFVQWKRLLPRDAEDRVDPLLINSSMIASLTRVDQYDREST